MDLDLDLTNEPSPPLVEKSDLVNNSMLWPGSEIHLNCANFEHGMLQKACCPMYPCDLHEHECCMQHPTCKIPSAITVDAGCQYVSSVSRCTGHACSPASSFLTKNCWSREVLNGYGLQLGVNILQNHLPDIGDCNTVYFSDSTAATLRTSLPISTGLLLFCQPKLANVLRAAACASVHQIKV